MRLYGNPTLLSLCLVFTANGQYSESDRVVLPADKTDAEITLLLRSSFAKPPEIASLRVEDAKGNAVSPQPAFGEAAISGDKLTLRLTGLFFWGQGKIRFQIATNPATEYSYAFQRGPFFDQTTPALERGKSGQLWLYNFGTRPLDFRWRIVSGTDSVCGIEANGQPKTGCDGLGNWAQFTIDPASSEAIRFRVPDSWFNAFHGVNRDGLIELRFGSDVNAPLLRQRLKLHLTSRGSDLLSFFVPVVVQHVLWVTLWVTFGAVLLMLAQVMIPNFRKCLTMENQIEVLQERLRAISSDVGSRLYTRCQQELESVIVGLAMRTGTSSRFLSFDRLALAGNSQEVARLTGILPKIESRISLTERLNERLSAASDSGSRDLPPSLYWDRAKQMSNVRTILSRQFVTDTDEKSASASLDLLSDAGAAMKNFAAELETRIAGIRREFETEPFKSKYPRMIAGLNGCTELLAQDPAAAPQGGWSQDEIINRDLAAVRLAAIAQMIRIEPLLPANSAQESAILKKLGSDDPGKLAEAGLDIAMVSQGVTDTDVTTALAAGLWDVYAEPETVTNQDVLRVSFVFRETRIEQSAAKGNFRCYWKITVGDDRGTARPSLSNRVAGWFRKDGEGPQAAAKTVQERIDEPDMYEFGWYSQFIPVAGSITVAPRIDDAKGAEVTIRNAKDPDKGVIPFEVGAPPRNALHKRLLRGLLDAAITAIVPVVTVALTQVQNGGDLALDKLVLLGFTSQAIRAAVVPESVTGGPKTAAAKPAA